MINMLLRVFTAPLADQVCLLPDWRASFQKVSLHHLMDKQNIHVLQVIIIKIYCIKKVNHV
jgi:hypothetical protein